MKIASDDLLPNCILTWASAKREYDQIDIKKGWNGDNLIHAIFVVLKLLPLVGNLTFISQKLWRLRSTSSGKTDEKTQVVSKASLKPAPENNSNIDDTLVIKQSNLPVQQSDSTETTIEKKIEPLSPGQKATLELLQNDPAVLISLFEGIQTYENALFEIIKKNYVFTPGTVFLAATKKDLDAWQKGTQQSQGSYDIPRLDFYEIYEDNFREVKLNRLGYIVSLDIDGKFMIPGHRNRDLRYETIKELEAAHKEIRSEKHKFALELKAPILKEAYYNALKDVEIPLEVLQHPRFAGKFLDSRDFREQCHEPYGRIYYSAVEKCYFVYQCPFTFENGNFASKLIYPEEKSFVTWFERMGKREQLDAEYTKERIKI